MKEDWIGCQISYFYLRDRGYTNTVGAVQLGRRASISFSLSSEVGCWNAARTTGDPCGDRVQTGAQTDAFLLAPFQAMRRQSLLLGCADTAEAAMDPFCFALAGGGAHRDCETDRPRPCSLAKLGDRIEAIARLPPADRWFCTWPMTRSLLGELAGTAVFRNYQVIFEFGRQTMTVQAESFRGCLARPNSRQSLGSIRRVGVCSKWPEWHLNTSSVRSVLSGVPTLQKRCDRLPRNVQTISTVRRAKLSHHSPENQR